VGKEKRGREEEEEKEMEIMGIYCSRYYIGQTGHSMNCINTKYS
jgi:hypothetical protein